MALQEENRLFVETIFGQLLTVGISDWPDIPNADMQLLAWMGTAQACIESAWGRDPGAQDSLNWWGIEPVGDQPMLPRDSEDASRIRQFPTTRRAAKSWWSLVLESTNYTVERMIIFMFINEGHPLTEQVIREFARKWALRYCPRSATYANTLDQIMTEVKDALFPEGLPKFDDPGRRPRL